MVKAEFSLFLNLILHQVENGELTFSQVELDFLEKNGLKKTDRLKVTQPQYVFNLHKVCERNPNIGVIQPKWKVFDTYFNTDLRISWFKEVTSADMYKTHEVILDSAYVDNVCSEQTGFLFRPYLSKQVTKYPSMGILQLFGPLLGKR